VSAIYETGLDSLQLRRCIRHAGGRLICVDRVGCDDPHRLRLLVKFGEEEGSFEQLKRLLPATLPRQCKVNSVVLGRGHKAEVFISLL
jgi:hypothetical protein